MNDKLGMRNEERSGIRNEELGIRNAAHPPGMSIRSWGGGWEFLIPNSYFLISMLRSGRKT
jgi:hypothetical protein